MLVKLDRVICMSASAHVSVRTDIHIMSVFVPTSAISGLSGYLALFLLGHSFVWRQLRGTR